MKAFVFSVNPQPVRMEAGQYGTMEIGACPKGEPYAVLVVQDRVITKDLGDDRIEKVSILGSEIADDLVQRYRQNGIFWSQLEKPTKGDLATAGELYAEACRQAVSEADSIWDRTHDRGKIAVRARNAAEHLGLSRKWNEDGALSNTKRCPFCAESIMADARKCKECGEWLDGTKGTTALPGVTVTKSVSEGAAAR